MKQGFSIDQRLHFALSAQEVEEAKAIHSYTHAINYNREEWQRIWCPAEKNATWAHSFGRFTGWHAVWYNSVVHSDESFLNAFIGRMKHMPEYEGRDCRSAGGAALHSLASGVIEVAEDGQSARSWYLTPGTMVSPTGPAARGDVHRDSGWLWERYGSDFVYYKGSMKYIHEHVCPDIGSNYELANWAHDNYERLQDPNFKAPKHSATPAFVSETDCCHKTFTLVQPVQHTVDPPKPYQTLDDDNSYAKGHNTIE
jgi:hypothetical protein